MAYNLEHLQVQLVEDNRNMRRLVRAMLEALGVGNVHEYANGKQAIRGLRDVTPDLIITDWMMEPVDGLEYTSFIRTDIKSPDVFLPIILMTGHTEQWRVTTARDAGVNELLAKPVSAKTLYDRILAVIEKPRPFVRTKSFFGPCRRRVNWADYMGPERRARPASTGKIADLGGTSPEQEVADVERLLETL